MSVASSREVQPSPGGLEVYPPGQGLEVVSHGLELNHDPRNPLPEPDPGRDPELATTRETVDKEVYSIRANSFSQRHWGVKRRWIALLSIFLIVALAAILGGVFGSRANQDQSPPKQPSATAAPPNHNSTIDAAKTIQLNTSVASTSCPNGDRWLFVQDGQNSIRAAQFTASSSTWLFSSNSTIPGKAKAMSPLAASCVKLVTDQEFRNLTLAPGLLISIVYFDVSNLLKQTYFHGSSWTLEDGSSKEGQVLVPWLGDAEDIPRAVPCSPDSRLSISTEDLPRTASSSDTFLSSVAVYHDLNNSAVMVDLVGTTLYTQPVWDESGYDSPDYISNMFSQFRYYTGDDSWSQNRSTREGYTTSLNTSAPGGLACLYNTADPGAATSGSTIFSNFSSTVTVNATHGNLSMICVSPNVRFSAHYEDSMLGINDSSILGVYSGWYLGGEQPPRPSNTTEMALHPLADSRYAVLFQSANGTIELATLNNGAELDAFALPSSSLVPDYPHFSSSMYENSTTIYVYYQINSSMMAEISFDVENGFWSLDPVYIDIGKVGLGS